MNGLLSSWLAQNIAAASLLAALLLLARRLLRREYWRSAFRQIARRRGAMACLAVLCAYAGVALLDSVGWRSPLRHPETGEILRREESGEILYDQGRSALDRLLRPLAERREKTYSAPLSDRQYTFETCLDGEGRSRRMRPALRHPGSHVLGTDRIGVDVLYLSCKSIRTGMVIGVFTTLLAIPFALLAGITAGYFGGWVDDAIQYVYSVLNSIPTILFIAAFMLIFGNGLFQLCFAMGIASWTTLCRLLRGETLRLREAEFVQAARALGQSHARIIAKHILPNVLHLILITAVLRFSSEVLSEAALTYLGIGVDADTISWGTMITDARMELTRDPVIWWKILSAFVFMLGLVLPANVFGDAVRDALDPRLRE